MSALAALAGAAASQILSKTLKGKVKNMKSSKTTNKNKNKNKNKTRKTGSSSSSSYSTSTPTVANFGRSNVIRTNLSRSHIVPFNCLNVYLRTDTNKFLAFTDAPASMISYALDLSLAYPFALTTEYPIFGIEVDALRSVYSKWRLRELTIEYVSSSPATLNGLLALGYDPDPFASQTSPKPLGTIASMSQNMRCPMYQAGTQPATLRITNLDPEFKFVIAGENNVSDSRLTSFGSIYVASLGIPNASFTVGAIGLKGVIEFLDLVPPLLNANTALPRPGPTDNAPLLSNLAFKSDGLSATAAAPFGTITSYDPAINSYIFANNHVVVFPLLGTYRYSGYWVNIVGVVTAPAAVNNDSIVYSPVAIDSAVFNTIAPYDFTFHVTATVPGQYLGISGPVGMTAGDFFGTIVQIS